MLHFCRIGFYQWNSARTNQLHCFSLSTQCSIWINTNSNITVRVLFALFRKELHRFMNRMRLILIMTQF